MGFKSIVQNTEIIQDCVRHKTYQNQAVMIKGIIEWPKIVRIMLVTKAVIDQGVSVHAPRLGH